MAIIEAKYNDTPYVWNPLDPNCWEGGVVPGRNDTARFRRGQTVYSTYENNYKIGLAYVQGPNCQDSRYVLPSDFKPMYQVPLWSQINSELIGLHNNRSGSELGTTRQYGGAIDDPNSDYNLPGLYNTSLGYINTYGSSGSYNKSSDNNWKFNYKTAFHFNNNSNIPNRYFLFGRQYYNWYNYKRSSTKFTVDGVTIEETDQTRYGSGSRRTGETKDEFIARNNGQYPIADRMVDLFTGSALHVSNGGRWHVVGPHISRYVGSSYYTDYYLNRMASFTVFTTTGSEYRNSGYNSSPSMPAPYYPNDNLYSLDMSAYIRAKHAFGINGVDGFKSGSVDQTGHIVPTTKNLIDEEHPGFYMDEPTGSIKYGTPGVSANQGYYWWYISGSGHFYLKTENFRYTGVGPGNPDIVRLKFEDMRHYNFAANVQVDPEFGTWSTSSRIHYPMFQSIGGYKGYGSNNISNGPAVYNSIWYSDNLIQRWELTGSQEWEVGRIEMGLMTHFHVKDNAKITMYDINSGTATPSIDFQDYGILSTLLVTDSAQMEITSSRSSAIPFSTYGPESGIYMRRDSISVIISGSANYSSSIVSAPANEKDTTIQIANASSSFGVGDYITIQSTGSIRVDSLNKDDGLNYVSETDKSTWFKASLDTGSLMHQRSMSGYQVRPANPGPGGSAVNDGQLSAAKREFTHAMETDEIVQVMTMSGDFVTVGKMYGKEGEIQSDMGLFTQDQFTETFGEPTDTIYEGSKRVVLVDSNHKNFKTNDTLIINGNAHKVLHATTYLSQSLFREFTSSNQPPLDEVFDLETAYFSGSSIWPIPSNTYGSASAPNTYMTEEYKKDRLLITGSYRGSRFYQDYFQTNNGYYPVYTSMRTLGGKSGSNTNPATGETHRALQLDATQGYTWAHIYRPWINNTSYAYRFNNLNGGKIWGHFQLKNTDNWEEGEILISGSILRNGLFDNSGSHFDGSGGQTGFGVTWGETPYAGPSRARNYYSYDGQDHDAYIYPNPRNTRISITQEAGGNIVRTNGRDYYSAALSFNVEHSGSVIRTYYYNPAQPRKYPNRRFYPSIYSDPIVQESGIDLLPAVNNYTSSWHPVSQSMISQYGDRTGGSCHIKIVKQEDEVEYYLGGSNGKEFLVDRFLNPGFKGRIALYLRDFGSIYSVNVKTRWQQLILDTDVSFNYRDKIKEGGLLHDHYVGKESKFIATEVVDAKGFKNLLWDYAYKKGDTNILPYMFAVCGTGTTAGNTSNTLNSPWNMMTNAYNSHQVLHPKSSGANSYWSYGQSNANYYVIFDFRTQVEFDTVGVIHCKDNHQRETDATNKMNDVQFEVCDDVGVENPAWETVVAEYDDTRQSGGQGDIRFYTFPSGSVNKRFIKWKNRGGTSSTNYRYFQHFGIYNFSGSCADTLTPAPNQDYTDVYGGPSASLCQVELANVKNFSVGDYIMFWSKQMYHTVIHSPSYNITTEGYKNVHALSGYFDKTTPEAGVLGGFHQTHKITAISGNVVTLDKPITHCHMGDGTMAYKYNRGKVKFIGDRATPFYIYEGYSNPSNYLHVSNATFINGSVVGYSINAAQNTYRITEDVGAGLYQMNYQYPAKPGFFRNIVSTNINLDCYGSTSVDNFTQHMFFNIFNVYKNTDYGGYLDIRHQRSVMKFCVDLSKSYAGINILANNNYGGRTISGKATIADNFIRGDYRGDISMVGGVRIDRGSPEQVNLSNQLVIKRNVTPLGYAPDFVSNGTELYSMGAFADRGTIELGDPEHITMNTFFNPFYRNPRFREATQAGSSSDNVGTNAKAANWPFGRHPALVYASQKKFFGNRNYIVTGEYYLLTAAVKSLNFANNKLFEFYTIGDVFPNYDITSQASCTPIFCKFFVKEDNTQVRIDLEFIYKTMLQRVYASELVNFTNRGWNLGGESVCIIGLEDNESKNFLGEVHYLNSTTLKDISNSKIYTLNKGSYNFQLRMRTGYYHPVGDMMFAVEKMDLKLVTNNLNNIDVTYSNWDLLKLFDNPKHYSSMENMGFTSNSGRNRVLRQTTNLNKKLKFNKLKL